MTKFHCPKCLYNFVDGDMYNGQSGIWKCPNGCGIFKIPEE